MSVLSDVVKLFACLGMIGVLRTEPSDLLLTLLSGLLGGLVAIGNTQSLVAYEKIMALTSKAIDRDVNLLGRIDQTAMVLGLMLYRWGFTPMLMVTAATYAMNALGYWCSRQALPQRAPVDSTPERRAMSNYLALIMCSPLLLSTVMLELNHYLHLPESILLNTDLHAEEHGYLPYGGQGPAASCIWINGERFTGSTLPQRDIYNYLVKPSLEHL